MNAENKTAIIMVGGGMKSPHGGGFLYAMATELGIPSPDIMIASSGDAGSILYFCTGEYESMRRVWTEWVSTPQFISVWRFWRIMDVDYLVDTVFKQQEPLNIKKLAATTIQWQIPITDVDSGETRYIGAKNNVDPFETLRATKAIPILFGKKIAIGKHRYIDGEFGPTLDDHVRHAFALGAQRIVIVNHLAPWTLRRRVVACAYALLRSRATRRALLRDIFTSITHFDGKGAEVLFVNPQRLPTGTATRDQEKVRATFARGYQDALALKDELRTLFNV
ncbi:MAG TPA: hypothetical protein VI483_00650 [Candidatus Paceibacterota bacterium]